eukprot:XP_001710264.1 Hypothetical protein GL50803_37127 [Giardia lamblia ATCC 50803]
MLELMWDPGSNPDPNVDGRVEVDSALSTAAFHIAA